MATDQSKESENATTMKCLGRHWCVVECILNTHDGKRVHYYGDLAVFLVRE